MAISFKSKATSGFQRKIAPSKPVGSGGSSYRKPVVSSKPNITPSKSPSTMLSAITQAPMRTVDQFKKLYDFSRYFDPQRASEAQRGRVDRFFLPQLEKRIEGSRSDFANRNLLRSGIRVDEERNINEDVADESDQMLQQLVSQVLDESTKSYETDMSRFLEDRSTDPNSFNPNTSILDSLKTDYDLSEPTGDLDRYGIGFDEFRKRSRAQSFKAPTYTLR
jgi:hypothetical protein